MRDDVLTGAWARELAVRLNRDERYRQAASEWEGSIVLALDREAGYSLRAAYLDLWHGKCQEAREASSGDLEEADFVLQASEASWRSVLEGRLEVATAVMTGKLRLVRGSLARIIPHAEAARALLAVARDLEEER